AWLTHDFRNFHGIFLKGIQVRSDDAFCPSVLHYLSRKKFDIIVLGGYGTPTSALSILHMRTFHIPFVLNLDGGFIREGESKLKRAMKKFFISSASWWICSGKYTKETLKYYGAKEDRIFIYPFTSIRQSDILTKPLSKEEKLKLRKELGMKEEKIILSVGQFIPRKGFDLLIKASKSIPKNVGVYIVGGKPPQEYLDLAKAFDVEEKVHFVDFKLKQELKKYYMAADLFVLPTREDIWGLVINEAMACGLPLITTNRCIAGLELIKNE
ncbi:glycosyltransferase, partial [Pseudothermotoga sp.]|uniref:glycosyltransferase n=1 Tax=Pseudothermotoga sp. TaxID=2033661 RepID=UPI0031F70390